MPPPGVKVREGYEIWHPNQEKSSSKTMKAIIALVLLVSAALLVIITLGGWDRLQGGGVGVLTIAWAALYVIFALLVMNWRRGLLPLSAAMAMVMLIFAAVAADGWFARAKDGLTSPALPEELLGLLTIIVIPVQILLIVVAMIGFNQAWNVEEERPIGGRAGAGPGDDLGPGTPPPAAVDHEDDDYPTDRNATLYVEREDDGDWSGTSPAI